jgi:flagellar hook-basal body complex protein FliE
MNDIRVSELLAQMRALALQAQGQPPPASGLAEGSSFAALIRDSIDAVNHQQQQAARLAQAFEVGDPQVDLGQVMVALQKASLSFQAMTQVRNKLVSAYQEIMNMPL